MQASRSCLVIMHTCSHEHVRRSCLLGPPCMRAVVLSFLRSRRQRHLESLSMTYTIHAAFVSARARYMNAECRHPPPTERHARVLCAHALITCSPFTYRMRLGRGVFRTLRTTIRHARNSHGLSSSSSSSLVHSFKIR